MNEFASHHDSMPRRIGFLPRFAAGVIDQLAMSTCVFFMAWKGWKLGQDMSQRLGVDEFLAVYAPMEDALIAAGIAGGLLALLAASALIGGLYPLIEGLTGASPGKWMLGLQVGRDDGGVGNVGLFLKRAMIKSVQSLLVLASALTGIAVLGFLAGPAGLVIQVGTLMMLAPHRQALHDKLAQTAVYRRRELRGG
ncbi:MAG: RDD family protein [Bacteroidetes bacterium]|nr:RDD family protein [Bacteroidota bacterium]MDA0904534.1 RDD family protein [Bacteroidota bacterium]